MCLLHHLIIRCYSYPNIFAKIHAFKLFFCKAIEHEIDNESVDGVHKVNMKDTDDSSKTDTVI